MAFDFQQFQGLKEAVGLRGALVQANQYVHGVYENEGDGNTLTGHDDREMKRIRKKYGISEDAPVRRFHIQVYEKGHIEKDSIIKHKKGSSFQYLYVVDVKEDEILGIPMKKQDAENLIEEMPGVRTLLLQESWGGTSLFGRLGDLWWSLWSWLPSSEDSENSNLSFVLLSLGAVVAVVVMMVVLMSVSQ